MSEAGQSSRTLIDDNLLDKPYANDSHLDYHTLFRVCNELADRFLSADVVDAFPIQHRRLSPIADSFMYRVNSDDLKPTVTAKKEVGTKMDLAGKASLTAAHFYRSALAERISYSDVWRRQFATAALAKALAAIGITHPPAAPTAMPADPTGPAERLFAGSMQDILDRFYGTPYMRVLEAMTALAYYRLAMLLYLLPGAGLLLLPVLLDAAPRHTHV